MTRNHSELLINKDFKETKVLFASVPGVGASSVSNEISKVNLAVLLSGCHVLISPWGIFD